VPQSSRPTLVLCVAIAAGLLGFLAGPGAGLTLWIAWIGVWSLPAGWLLGAARVARPIAVLLPSGVWFGCAWAFRGQPGLIWAALASAGLLAIGWAGGGRARSWVGALRGAGVSLALLAFPCWLPSAGALTRGAPWTPAVAARLLDLSPATLLVECAEIDWMRHPATYDPVGADAIGPHSRLPWRGKLAGPVLLLVGYATTLATRRADWKPQCPPASSSAPSRRT
jgi:hypothetical protein